MINLYKDVYVTFRKITKKTCSKRNKKPTAIKLGSEQVDVQIQLEDQSKISNFDIVLLKERIKRKGLTAPRIEVKIDDEKKDETDEPEKVDVPISKPKKLKSTVKLPGKNDQKNKTIRICFIRLSLQKVLFIKIYLWRTFKN